MSAGLNSIVALKALLFFTVKHLLEIQEINRNKFNDGVISIIDPVTATISAQVQTGGNPHSPVRVGGSFACCDSWGSSIFFYNESGSLQSTWIPDSSITMAGLAVCGDTFYMTDFAEDKVYMALWQFHTLSGSLSAGDGPQGIVSIER